MKRYFYVATSLICVFLCLLNYTECMGQKSRIKPLHTFLQQHADTTIVFKYESNWMSSPVYWAISKKDDTITRYIYKSNDKLARMPKLIRDTISKINKAADYRVEVKELYSININKYFNALYTDDKSIRIFWKELKLLKPWEVTDDSIEGESCPKNKHGENNQIYDGGGISLFLITKEEIKHLYFYAPQHYEKVCPGKKGRKTVLQIEQLFKENFK